MNSTDPKPTKLTPLHITAAKPEAKAWKLSDPQTSGMFVLIQPGGTKTFIYSFSLKNKRSEMTLGRFPSFSLSEARKAATEARVHVERGEDPAAKKKAERAAEKAAAAPPSTKDHFRTFAAKWQAEKLAGRAESYRNQIQSRLDRFIFPKIGTKALAEVKPKDVLEIIQPLQVDTPVTAEGVRGIVQNIFNYAVQLLLVDANPALPLRGVVTVPPSENARHLSPTEFAAFWRSLSLQAGAHASTIAAARLLVYTLTRKGETLRAKWSEVDLPRGIWTIPATRTKTKVVHRVYLSRQASELLEAQRTATGQGEYIFPSAFRDSVPLGDATLNHLFKRLDFGVPEFSPHGTRSTAATILRENGIRRDVVELLLSHTEKGVAAHYHHHELAKERAEALQWWADEIDRMAAGAQFTSEDLDADDDDPDDEELEETPHRVVEVLGFDPKGA